MRENEINNGNIREQIRERLEENKREKKRLNKKKNTQRGLYTMNVLSRYTFISSFNAEKLTKQQSEENGISNKDFAVCDTNGDGNITIDEILANQDICDKILKAIQAKIDKLTAEEAGVKTEQAKAEKEPEKFQLAA